MKTLKSCIRKAGITVSKSDGETLRALQKSYVSEENMSGGEAANHALNEFIETLQDERSEVAGQVSEQGGVVPDYVSTIAKPAAAEVVAKAAATEPVKPDDLLVKRSDAKVVTKKKKPAKKAPAKKAPPPGLSKKAAEDIVRSVTDNWKGNKRYSEVVVVERYSDLPAALKAQAKEQGAENDIDGAYHKGKLYLVTEELRTREDVERVIFHEAYAHDGLARLFGEDLRPTMGRLFMAIGGAKGLNKIAEDNNIDLTAYAEGLAKAPPDIRNAIMMEELLAHIQQDTRPAVKKQFKALIGEFRQWLREHGFPGLAELGETDLLNLLASAKEAVIQDTKPGTGAGTRFMVAYHGSPHKFDRFSLEAMGSGEGAQAYGWGMYFAGKRSVAEWYRDKLSGAGSQRITVNGREVTSKDDGELYWIGLEIAQRGRDDIIDYADDTILAPDVQAAVDILRTAKVDYISEGNIYQVDIPKDSELLDWDKPIIEQATVYERLKPVIEFLEKKGYPIDAKAVTGENIYNRLVGEMALEHDVDLFKDAPQLASEALGTEGVKGLRYFDAASRKQGDGHHNYVIWDESAVTVEAVNDEGAKAEEQESKFSRRKPTQELTKAFEKLGLAPDKVKKATEKLGRIFDRNWRANAAADVYSGTLDRSFAVKRHEDKLGVGMVAGDYGTSGYIGMRLATGIADTMHGIMKWGAPVWKAGVVQQKGGTIGALELFESLGPDLNDWLGWMGGNRGAELMKDDRENNLTQADIDQLKGLINDGNRKKFETAKKEYGKINTAMLDLAEQAGEINAERRAEWESEWYIPFNRFDATTETAILPSRSNGISHQTSGIKRLTGSEMATNDLLENIIAGWVKLADSSMQNAAMLKTVDNFIGTGLISNESKKFRAAMISNNQIATMIKNDREMLQQVAAGLGMPEGATAIEVAGELVKPHNKGFSKLWAAIAPTDPDVIRVMRGGEFEYYKVHDAAILKAVTDFREEPNNSLLMKGLRGGKNILTAGVVISPDFIVRNMIRDAVHSWAINKDNMSLGFSTLEGFSGAYKESATYRSMSFGGASFQGGYIHGTDPEATARIIRRDLAAKGLNKREADTYMETMLLAPGQVAGAVNQFWLKYRELGDKVENASRLATFESALGAGKPLAQAMFESKDLMDYSLRGSYAAVVGITDTVAFMNARVQGMSKLIRVAKDDPQGWKIYRNVIIKSGLKLASASLLLAMWNDDDERYQELKDWDKDANWHFWVGDQHWRLPKPFEIGVIFGTMPERLYHTLATDTQENERLTWSIKHNLWQTLALNPLPTMLMPSIEAIDNLNWFRDSPIESMGDSARSPRNRYNAYTSETMVELGKWTNTSPKMLEHLFVGHTGTIGGYLLEAVDQFTRWSVDAPVAPTRQLNEYPVIKSFYRGSGEPQSIQATTDVYKRRKEVAEIMADIQFKKTNKQFEDVKERLAETVGKRWFKKKLDKAAVKLGKIRRQEQMILGNRVMTAKAKYKALESLKLERHYISQDLATMTAKTFAK